MLFQYEKLVSTEYKFFELSFSSSFLEPQFVLYHYAAAGAHNERADVYVIVGAYDKLSYYQTLINKFQHLTGCVNTYLEFFKQEGS